MTLWTPDRAIKTPVRKTKSKTKVYDPTREHEYRLPMHILSPQSFTEEDGEFLDAMREYDPATNLKPGDVVRILEVPPYLRNKLRFERRLVPVFWKVRFVVSAWAFELHNMAHALPTRFAGIDHAVNMMEVESKLEERHYQKPFVYAHAMPHGKWPDTAAWFPGRVLRKATVREANPGWDMVLDEAKAPFLGYDEEALLRPFVLPLAPDLYGDGENIGKPFNHEEATIHTMCLLGMEDFLLGDHANGVDPRFIESQTRPIIDPYHDIYADEEDDDADGSETIWTRR